MTNFFSPKQIQELQEDYDVLHAKVSALVEALVTRTYGNERAEEYATHGLSRRLRFLIHCVDRVFETLPPDRDTVPDRIELLDATMNIQAFTFNLFGFLDNLAWVWVLERGVTGDDGKPLGRMQVGLNKKYKKVRASFSPTFSSYLEGLQKWFEHITDFRDALAHRVPLYIPPTTIHPDNGEQWNDLWNRSQTALLQANLAAHATLEAERKSLEHFQPLMIHSINEGSRPIIFHAQLISDLKTIEEMTQKFLQELGIASP